MIDVIVGPMYSGKTTRMIKKIEKNKSIGKNQVTIQWKCDNREGNTQNHIGVKIPPPIIKANKLCEIENLSSYDLICIDDAHFFADLPQFVEHNKNLNLYICGLNEDYLQQKFTNVTDLYGCANVYIKLQGICELCKGKSSHTIRKETKFKERILPGNSDIYIPVCEYHAIQHQKILQNNQSAFIAQISEP